MKTAPGSEKMLFPLRGLTAIPAPRIVAAGNHERQRLFWTTALSGVLLTGISIAFVDRPASTLMHSTKHGISIIPAAAWMPLLPIITAILAAAVGILALSRQPNASTRTLIACCLAVMIALVIKEQLKFAFGRTWPESWTPGSPSWNGTGAYGFHPFHGGSAWASFPSGHMAAVTAAAAVLWQRVRNLRWLWGSLVTCVALVIFGLNCHFVGDIIAGGYLGVGCAATVLTLLG
jgi:membrane-associated phospholipid phosphatase